MQSQILIITGHYGSGKTNYAVNLAVDAAKLGKKVCIVDLDIVNPYFRTADFKALFDRWGITLMASKYVNSNLDIPALGFAIDGALNTHDQIIVDVGGDDAGAFALGRFKRTFANAGYEMRYVVNGYRYLTRTAEEALALMREIEQASSLSCTGIVHNANLGKDTTAADILAAQPFAEQVAETAGLPIIHQCCNKAWALCNTLPSAYPVEIYVKPIWDVAGKWEH